MRLASEQQVLERLNLQNVVQWQKSETITSALEAATALLESTLRTPLAEKSRIDYFDIRRGRYETGFTPYDIWLKQAFLQTEPTVYYAADGVSMKSVVSATELDSDSFIADLDRGKITILEYTPPGVSVLAVSYTAGFTDADTDEIIPDWLKECAVSGAILINYTQAVRSGKKDLQKMAKQLSAMFYSLVNEHIISPYPGVYCRNSVIV